MTYCGAVASHVTQLWYVASLHHIVSFQVMLFCQPFVYFFYNISPCQFTSSYLSVALSSLFSLQHIPLAFSLHTCPTHLSIASLIFSLMFATPAMALISSVLNFSVLFHQSSITPFSSLFFLADLVHLSYLPLSYTRNTSLFSWYHWNNT